MVSLGSLASKLFGSANDRRVKAYKNRVDAINALEAEVERLSDDELRGRTDVFRKRLADGAKINDLLPEAFATVREAAKRTLGQRHFDVQMIGGMALHEGKIAEMKTGEGKTLVATLPVYLNALTGNGVHVVTVNDYLAKRDAAWMGKVYDPEGVLSTASAVVTCLLGVAAGRVLRAGDRPLSDRVLTLAVAGISLAAAGHLWGYGLPVNKPLWTGSYALLTAGLASQFLALSLYFCDLRGHRRIVDGAPLGVAQLLGAQAVAHGAAPGELADSGLSQWQRWVAEERGEARALQVIRLGQSGEVAQRRIQAHQLDEGVCPFPAGGLARGANDQRHAGGEFEVGGFSPHAVIAQLKAVVTGKDDDRLLRQSPLGEALQHAPDLGIDIGHAGRVAMPELTFQLVTQRQLLR